MAEDGVDSEQTIPEVPEALKGRVVELFKLFDIDANGLIPLAQLSSGNLKVGPAEMGVLNRLADMDFNGDGFVEESEWLGYFGAIIADLNEVELEALMADLESSGNHVKCVHDAMKLANATEVVEADEDALADAASQLATLTEEQKAMVMDLFKTWDFDGNGVIDMGKIHTSGIVVGPRKERVFDDFEKMDVNGDKVVSPDEMLDYFSAAAALMSADELAAIITEMKDAASDEHGVSQMLALAAQVEASGFGAGVFEDDGEAPMDDAPPALSDANAEKVKNLFLLFSASVSEPILMTDLAQAKIEVGTSKMSVLDGMKAMDANGDGLIEFDEMKLYFAVVLRDVGDGASGFDTVMDELMEAGHIYSMQKMAKQFA